MEKQKYSSDKITESLLTISHRSHEVSKKMLNEFNSRNYGLKKVPSSSRIFLFFLTRAIKTHSAISILCRKGYGQDTATLLRTLLENLITARYILCDPKTADDKAIRFVDYKWIIFRRYLPNEKEEIDKITDQFRKKLLSKKDVIAKQINIFKTKYKIKSDRALITWSGRALRDMAKLCGKELVSEYDLTFRLSSRFSHPSIIGDQEYINYHDKFIVFSPYPSLKGIYENLDIATKYLLDFLEIFRTLYELSYQKNIMELKDALQTLHNTSLQNQKNDEAARPKNRTTNPDEIIIKFDKLG